MLDTCAECDCSAVSPVLQCGLLQHRLQTPGWMASIRVLSGNQLASHWSVREITGFSLVSQRDHWLLIGHSEKDYWLLIGQGIADTWSRVNDEILGGQKEVTLTHHQLCYR